MENDPKKVSTMLSVLDWAYEKSLNGVPGLGSAEELAENYISKGGEKIDTANSLIRWQIAKCATSGFISGVGGLVTLPIAIPANISSIIYIQIRMIAAIAHIGGYDIKSDQVKTLVYIALCGSTAKEVVKDIGIVIGTKITTAMIKNISRETILRINQAVGFRLLTKFGTTGVINLGKAVPIIGGIIGATIDGSMTNTVGNVARDMFVAKEASAGAKQ